MVFFGLQSVVRVAEASTKLNTLRVVQMNLLGHATMEGETAEAFTARLQLNVRQILSFRPTLCVLEECDDQRYEEELRAAGLNVVSEWKKVSGPTRAATVVAWHPSVHRLVQAERIPLFEEDGATESVQFALACRMEILGCFEESEQRKAEEFLVIAQHAKAGRTEEAETKRIRHAAQLFEWLAAYLALPTSAAIGRRVLWVGDMNASPHTYGGQYPSRWYSFVTQPRVGPSALGNNFVFESALKNSVGDEPLLTTCKLRDGKLISQTIDYVLYLSGSFKPTAYLPMPKEEILAPLYLPNPDWGSDHLLLFVELVSLPNPHG